MRTTVTISNGADRTRTVREPEVIAVNAGKLVRLTTFEQEPGGPKRLVSSLEMPREQLLHLLGAEVKRKPRTLDDVAASVQRLQARTTPKNGASKIGQKLCV